jgi:RNA polymerase sigma-70 factor (ECF subfamily)
VLAISESRLAAGGLRFPMMTDEQLILEFQKGSPEAFTELFLRYRDRVYGFFCRRVNDAAQAEELAQEAFLAVLRAVGRYEPRATFRAYLFGIAFKVLAAHRRKAGQERERSDVPVGAVDPPATEVASSEEVLWVRQAVEQLAADQQQVLMLREFEELSYEEIAGVLYLPVNTVRSRLFRARMALKDILVTTRGN